MCSSDLLEAKYKLGLFANPYKYCDVKRAEKEGINDRNDKGKSFRCDWIIGSLAGSGFENTYYCRVNFRVADQKLVYYISDVLIESPAFVMKKVTPLEKLTPDKKAAHKQTMEDFTQSESSVLNKLFDFISTNQLSEITHWDAISIRKPIKGMNRSEEHTSELQSR